MVGALDRLPYFEDGGPAIMAPPAAVSIIPGRTELDRGGWITTYRVVTAATERRDRVSTSRLEAFSDGVFAIAITVLVLDLAVGSCHAHLPTEHRVLRVCDRARADRASDRRRLFLVIAVVGFIQTA